MVGSNFDESLKINSGLAYGRDGTVHSSKEACLCIAFPADLNRACVSPMARESSRDFLPVHAAIYSSLSRFSHSPAAQGLHASLNLVETSQSVETVGLRRYPLRPSISRAFFRRLDRTLARESVFRSFLPGQGANLGQPCIP